jgi:hypothetical protein
VDHLYLDALTGVVCKPNKHHNSPSGPDKKIKIYKTCLYGGFLKIYILAGTEQYFYNRDYCTKLWTLTCQSIFQDLNVGSVQQ